MYLSIKAVPSFVALRIENASYPHSLGVVQWVNLWIILRYSYEYMSICNNMAYIGEMWTRSRNHVFCVSVS